MDENVGRRDEKSQSCTQISFSLTLKSEISLSLDREGYGYEIRETLGTSLDAIEHDFYQVIPRKLTQASWRDQTLHKQLFLL